MEAVVPRLHGLARCRLLFHRTPDQMEDEALQGAEVGPAELIYYRVHSSDHLPLVWLTWGEKKQTIPHSPMEEWRSLRRRRSGAQHGGGKERCNEEPTHGPEELLVQFKGHERARQFSEPLFENAGDDVDVVIIQVDAPHICVQSLPQFFDFIGGAGLPVDPLCVEAVHLDVVDQLLHQLRHLALLAGQAGQLHTELPRRQLRLVLQQQNTDMRNMLSWLVSR